MRVAVESAKLARIRDLDDTLTYLISGSGSLAERGYMMV